VANKKYGGFFVGVQTLTGHVFAVPINNTHFQSLLNGITVMTKV